MLATIQNFKLVLTGSHLLTYYTYIYLPSNIRLC